MFSSSEDIFPNNELDIDYNTNEDMKNQMCGYSKTV